MRNLVLVLWLLLCSITSAAAQVSVGIGFPGVSIGINVPVYPELVPVPGYPVYYAPRMNSNYFFYDGMYWVYQQDNWYASSWYNGPWGLVPPEAVPLYILRVPVRYYRQPPVYFRGWSSNAPPRWGEHWGNAWEQRRHGWDNWNRSAAPAPAPLPVYQRQYSGNRYPRAEQQQVLQNHNYRYQPRDEVVRQHYQGQPAQGAPQRQAQPPQGGPQYQGQPQGRAQYQGQPPQVAPPNQGQPQGRAQYQGQPPQGGPPHQGQQQGRAQYQGQPPQGGPPHQGQPPHGGAQRQAQPPQGAAPYEQQAPTPQKGHEKGAEKGQEKGGEHNK